MTRQYFVNTGSAPKAAEKLKVSQSLWGYGQKRLTVRQADSSDDEFLLSRILFLLTYGTDVDYEKLIKEHQLGENINQVGTHST